MLDSYSLPMKTDKPIPEIDSANRDGNNNVITEYMNGIIF
jgi:hypothetical protein